MCLWHQMIWNTQNDIHENIHEDCPIQTSYNAIHFKCSLPAIKCSLPAIQTFCMEQMAVSSYLVFESGMR
jgi:hypothetical protein